MRFLLLLLAIFGALPAKAAGPCFWGPGPVATCPPVQLRESGGGTDTVTIRAPVTVTAPYSLTLPSDGGTLGYLLTTDGSGNLSWLAPPGLDHFNLIENHDPLDVGSRRNSLQTNLNMSIDSPDAGITEFDVYAADGTDYQLGSLIAGNFSSNSSGSVDRPSIIGIQVDQAFGNASDPTILSNYIGVNQYLALSDNAEVTNATLESLALNSPASSTVDNYVAVKDNSNLVDVDTYRVFETTSTIALINSGYYGLDIHPNITTASNYVAVRDASSFSDVTNYRGFETASTIPQISSAYYGVDVHPNITNSDDSVYSYRANPTIGNADNQVYYFNAAGNVGSAANVQILDDGVNTTSVSGAYYELNLHPTIASGQSYFGIQVTPAATLSDDFKGVNIEPNAVGTSGHLADGIFINMDSVTGYNAGDIKAIRAIGNIGVTGKFNSNASADITDTGGNPQPINAISTTFTLPPATSVSNADSFGFNPMMTVNVGAGATASSSGLGLGSAALGMINLLNVGAGGQLDNAGGSFSTNVGISGSGNITNLSGYSASIVNAASTITLSNYYAYRYEEVGTWAANSWGIWSKPSYAQNWFGGHVKVGGTAGSTDKTANTSVGLEIQDTAFYPVPMTTAARDGLTALEGMIINNGDTGDLERYDGAAWAAVGGGGSGSLQDAYDNGTTITTAGAATVLVATPSGCGGACGVALEADGYSSGGDASFFADAEGNGAAIGTYSASDVQLDLQASSSGSFQLKTPANVTSYGWKVPATQGGAGTVLANDGSGNLSWTTRAILGANTFTAGQFIDGSSDQVQLRVQGHSTQTNDVLDVENSAGTVLFKVKGDGAVAITQNATSGGNVPHNRTVATDNESASDSCQAVCASGTAVVVGGGCQTSGSNLIINSFPSASNQWDCDFTAGAGSDCTAYAICFEY